MSYADLNERQQGKPQLCYEEAYLSTEPPSCISRIIFFVTLSLSLAQNFAKHLWTFAQWGTN